jgi:HNH endonuclease
MVKPRLDDPLTADQLRAVLTYYPKTGLFFWKSRPDIRPSANSGRQGKMAGTTKPIGYVYICINRRLYLAHRLAWFHVHGRWPVAEIDHINEVRTDNRLANLRECSHGENNTRSKARADNKSGVLGVFRTALSPKWQAQVQHQGVSIHVGMFDTIEEAKAARDEVARRLHGKFHRT